MDYRPPGSSVHGISQQEHWSGLSALLQVISRTQGWNLSLLHRQADSFLLSHQESPSHPYSSLKEKKKKEQEAAEMLPVGLEEAKCHVVGSTMSLTTSSDLWEMGTSAFRRKKLNFADNHVTSKRKPSSRNTYSPVSISIAAKWDSEQGTHFSCGWTPDSQKLWIPALIVNASCFQLLNWQCCVLHQQETNSMTGSQVVFPTRSVPEDGRTEVCTCKAKVSQKFSQSTPWPPKREANTFLHL